MSSSLEIDFEGKIIDKKGDFENENDNNLSKFIKNIIYILQDVNSIQKNDVSLGNFQKISIKFQEFKYDIAIGEKCIKLVKNSLK